jgi:hypothetical protein
LLALYVSQQSPPARSDHADHTGQGSYPHTPYSPTAASMRVWEEASDAILAPDMTIGYEARGMEEFAGSLRGGGCVRGWMRGWVEGRTLVRDKSGLKSEAAGVRVLMGQDELMKRPDVTAAFILTSTIAILASAQVSTTTADLPFPIRETGLMVSGAIGVTDFASRGHDSPCRPRFPRNSHRPRRCGASRLGHRCPSRRECHSHAHSQ